MLELEPPAPCLVAELSGRLGIEIDESDAERAIAAEISFYRAHLDEGRDPPSLAELRCAAPRRCAPRCPLVSNPGCRHRRRWSMCCWPRCTSGCIRRCARRLHGFRARGLRLVVVSNWDVSLHDVLDRLGLSAMLDGVLTSAQAGARKPSPVIFERALGIPGVSATEAVHVGDSLDEDVEGARAAGIEPVLVRRAGGPAPDGVQTIANLGELSV